jgi:hypothetical protein
VDKGGDGVTNKKAPVRGASILSGGDEGDRTPGLSVANAALSQLSYIPEKVAAYIANHPTGHNRNLE